MAKVKSRGGSAFPCDFCVSAMKITVPKAPWSAVAAATAFPGPALVRFPYEPRAEGGSCCYRTPRRCAHFYLRWRAHGSCESVVNLFFAALEEVGFKVSPMPFTPGRGRAKCRIDDLAAEVPTHRPNREAAGRHIPVSAAYCLHPSGEPISCPFSNRLTPIT